MELLVLGLFCAGLLLCILLDMSILYALAAGLALFLLYGRHRGFSWAELLGEALNGVKTIKNILITFVLIGMLTALWRAAGTIPVIVCYAAVLIRPEIFLLMTFLLNCGVSVLTGTAFGTAATMGVICATMGATLQIDPVLVGGAVLSGVFFGDRCSPVSTSALLVAELTQTNIFTNLKYMTRTAAVPFLAACGVYGGLGLLSGHGGELLDLNALFGREFVLSPVALAPAVVILILSALRVSVKKAMSVSILTALPICLWVQQVPLMELVQAMLTGFHTQDAQLSAMINGGGITSMVKVAAIVSLSSSYSGIFQKTGLLNSAKQAIAALSGRTTPYFATLCTAIVASMIACNQTLAIMLTQQLCSSLREDPQATAIDLEDSAVVVAPLVPWSIAGAVPLASVGAPSASVLLACYLYLVPLWRTVTSLVEKKKVPRTA